MWNRSHNHISDIYEWALWYHREYYQNPEWELPLAPTENTPSAGLTVWNPFTAENWRIICSFMTSRAKIISFISSHSGELQPHSTSGLHSSSSIDLQIIFSVCKMSEKNERNHASRLRSCQQMFLHLCSTITLINIKTAANEFSGQSPELTNLQIIFLVYLIWSGERKKINGSKNSEQLHQTALICPNKT